MDFKQKVIDNGLIEAILVNNYKPLREGMLNLSYLKDENTEFNIFLRCSKKLLNEITEEEIKQLIKNLPKRELNGFEFTYMDKVFFDILSREYILLNKGEKLEISPDDQHFINIFLEKIKEFQVDTYSFGYVSAIIDSIFKKESVHNYKPKSNQCISNFDVYFNDKLDLSFGKWIEIDLHDIVNVVSPDIIYYNSDIILHSIFFERPILTLMLEHYNLLEQLNWNIYPHLNNLSKLKILLPECERIFKTIDIPNNYLLNQFYMYIMKADNEQLEYPTTHLRNRYLHGDYDLDDSIQINCDRCLVEFLFTCLLYYKCKSNESKEFVCN